MGANEAESWQFAIVGSGQAAVATIINKLVHIAYNTMAGLPAVRLMVIKTQDAVYPAKESAYPLMNHAVRGLHPFVTQTPPQGFPTFGEYVDEMVEADPSLADALVAPTWQQVDDYMEYMLELAVMTVEDKAYVDATDRPIDAIDEIVAGGPAAIRFADGTHIEVARVIRASWPAHLTGAGVS